MTDPRITKELIEALAKRMADAASDWLHNNCGGDEHWLEHSNWEAYTEDAKHALEAVFALLPEPEAGDIESSEWRYFTQLDGDYAEESATVEQAEHVRRYASGHIPPGERKVSRERTQWQPVPDTNEGETR